VKKHLIISFFVIIGTVAHAQFGVKGGINMAILQGSNVISDRKKALFGYYAGISYNIRMDQSFSIRPELYYSTQGVKYKGESMSERFVFGYMNLDLLVPYKSASGFFFGLGPQVGFLMNAKDKLSGNADVNIRDQMKDADFAIVATVGSEMSSGLCIHARYNHGLTTTAKAANTKVFNRVIQIGICYQFSSGSRTKQ